MRRPRTMHELLRDVSRAIGYPHTGGDELRGIAKAITLRAKEIVADLDAIATRRDFSYQERMKREAAAEGSD